MPAAAIPACEQTRVRTLRDYMALRHGAAETLDRFARLAAGLLCVPYAAVSLVGAAKQHLVGTFGLTVRDTPRSAAFCAHAILGTEPLVVEDATLDPRFADSPLVTHEPGIRFYIGAPLIAPDGMRIGTICGFDTQPRKGSAEQQTRLKDLATALMMTLDLLNASDKLKILAVTDALTGLSNRLSLVEALEASVAHLNQDGTPFSLLYLDCDRFKRLNDECGHAAGDTLLRLFSDELRTELRAADVPARMGGDEFAVVLPGADLAEASATAGRILANFRFMARAGGWRTSLSIGVVSCRGGRPTAEEVLSAADAAMYQAKAAGRDRVATMILDEADARQQCSWAADALR